MKANGKKDKHRVKVNSILRMVTFMMDNGVMENAMVMEGISIAIMPILRVIGRTMFNQVKVLKLGPMDLDMKVITKKAKSMASVSIPGLMVHSTKATGGMASCMV